MEKIVYPALIAFVLEIILCPILIPMLHRLKFGQYIREDGPKEHQKKAGTPTMGGIAILICFVAGALVFAKGNTLAAPILLVTLGFGLIGLLDDFIKVVMKHNEGLKEWQKFGLQILFAVLFAVYLNKAGYSTDVKIPFINVTWHMGWLYYVFVVLLLVGFDNGANFTDGLDGLATSVTVIIVTFLAVVSWGKGSDLLPVLAAAAGSLLGFLLFNTNPAKVFMGDTGSLALGALVTASAIVLEIPMLVFIIAFIYLLEVASVIIQVGYFKATGGKRIFKMAPIHHHFELCGWKETKVVTVFSIITAMLCLVALLLV